VGFSGRTGRAFIDWALKQARRARRGERVADKWATPTYTLDLAEC